MLCDPLDGLAELQANGAAAVRRNILATQQLLASLPQSGVSVLLLSSHRAAIHPSCPVQVWQFPTAFDPQATGMGMASDPSAAWLRERLADAFIDQLFGLSLAAIY